MIARYLPLVVSLAKKAGTFVANGANVLNVLNTVHSTILLVNETTCRFNVAKRESFKNKIETLSNIAFDSAKRISTNFQTKNK